MRTSSSPRWRGVPRLLTVLGLAAICMGSTSRSCSLANNDGDGGDDPSFVAHLEIRDVNGDQTDSFDRGESIDFVLTVRNRLDTTATAEFTTTRTSDFVVVRENTSDVVWQWSDDRGFSDVATTIEFAPGETRTFTATWNQVLSSGTQLRSGTYEARGVLVFSGFDSNPLRANQMGSMLERFTIR